MSITTIAQKRGGDGAKILPFGVASRSILDKKGMRLEYRRAEKRCDVCSGEMYMQDKIIASLRSAFDRLRAMVEGEK